MRPAGFIRSLCFIFLSCLLVAAAEASKLKVGDDPPDKFGKSASGERIHLSDYRGKVVVVSFWASWCPPCRAELPRMIALQRVATREKLIVLSINWQQPAGQFRVLRDDLKKFDLTLISDQYGSLGYAYNVTAIPHMVIIGKDGKIAAIHIGYAESELPALVDEINALLLKDIAKS
jgi:thiol-disulfide isomerase/thioredoxin